MKLILTFTVITLVGALSIAGPMHSKDYYPDYSEYRAAAVALKKIANLQAEVSDQEVKFCAVKEVNATARLILGTAESLYSNHLTNMTSVKLLTGYCVNLAMLIHSGQVPQISHSMVENVMNGFCTEANKWSFPSVGNHCDEAKYYK